MRVRQWDVLSSALGAMMCGLICHGMLARDGGKAVSSEEWVIVTAVLLLHNAPCWLALLLCRRWYTSHRDLLLVTLGGASRVVIAVGHGLLSPLTAQDHCVLLSHCFWVLALLCAVHFPVTQQLCFKLSALLTLVDVVGVASYAAFSLRLLLAGAACGLAAGCVALLVAAALNWWCRAQFLALGQAGRSDDGRRAVSRGRSLLQAVPGRL